MDKSEETPRVFGEQVLTTCSSIAKLIKSDDTGEWLLSLPAENVEWMTGMLTWGLAIKQEWNV